MMGGFAGTGKGNGSDQMMAVQGSLSPNQRPGAIARGGSQAPMGGGPWANPPPWMFGGGLGGLGGMMGGSPWGMGGANPWLPGGMGGPQGTGKGGYTSWAGYGALPGIEPHRTPPGNPNPPQQQPNPTGPGLTSPTSGATYTPINSIGLVNYMTGGIPWNPWQFGGGNPFMRGGGMGGGGMSGGIGYGGTGYGAMGYGGDMGAESGLL